MSGYVEDETLGLLSSDKKGKWQHVAPVLIVMFLNNGMRCATGKLNDMEKLLKLQRHDHQWSITTIISTGPLDRYPCQYPSRPATRFLWGEGHNRINRGGLLYSRPLVPVLSRDWEIF